jgi:hypothetical protein
MPALISKIPQAERRKFLADLNYLNMAEIKALCKKYKIPYAIAVETDDGRRRKSSEHDRKGIMLQRLKHFLETGVILGETCFRAEVVRFEPLPKKLAASDRLFYGQYVKHNRTMMTLLAELTDGEFEEGAIARILAREFWTAGTAPTFEAFAAAWQKARREHTRPNPEWAFLSDRADGTAPKDWKKLRNDKARKVIRMLEKITSK